MSGSKVKIIQFMAMDNNETWQGHILGLGDDGVLYIDDGKNASWEVYIPLKFKSKESKQ